MFCLFWLNHNIFIMQSVDCQENLFVTVLIEMQYVL